MTAPGTTSTGTPGNSTTGAVPAGLDVDSDLDALEAEADAAAALRAARLDAVQKEAAQRGGGAGEGLEPYCSSVEEWVGQVFAPTYARRMTPTFRWCPQWWRHPEAIVRLEALWRSWEALRLDPLLGMASWLRDHLDSQLPQLTGPAGPFADCDPHRHFPPEDDALPVDPAPPGWWPPPAADDDGAPVLSRR